jgi:hypothetical protein
MKTAENRQVILTGDNEEKNALIRETIQPAGCPL